MYCRGQWQWAGLNFGELSKKISVSGCQYSTSAKEKIEKAGGKVT